MGVTILDVAAKAGVSKATVSRAFTNPSAVNADTLNRILGAAQALNYRPNAIARAMITKRTGNLAFIIYGEQAPVITNLFYGPILESVVKSAGDHGYSMFIASDSELRTTSGELILQKQVDGIIFSSQPNRDMVRNAKRSGIPMVFVNHMLEDCYCLVVDDRGGIKQAAEHLLSLGHTKIAMLAGLFTEFIRERRLSAFRDALAQSGVPYRPDWVLDVQPNISSAYDGMMKLLASKERPSAVLCMNDMIAVGAAKAAMRRGFHIPEDISIVGFDNSVLCAACEPELTSVDANTEALGARAVACLMAQLKGEHWENPVATMETKLILRGSTAAASK